MEQQCLATLDQPIPWTIAVAAGPARSEGGGFVRGCLRLLGSECQSSQ